MFSTEFMKFLINYQKTEAASGSAQKEINFQNKGGKLAEVLLIKENY